MGTEQALRAVRTEAGAVLHASGSPQTQLGRESRKKPGARTRARAGPARGLPRAASPPHSSPRGAGREHKRLQLPSGRGPTPPTPDRGRARREEADRRRQGGQERARMGQAGDPGRRARVGAGFGGRAPGVTLARGTPRMAEKRVSKNRQRPARRSG